MLYDVTIRTVDEQFERVLRIEAPDHTHARSLAYTRVASDEYISDVSAAESFQTAEQMVKYVALLQTLSASSAAYDYTDTLSRAYVKTRRGHSVAQQVANAILSRWTNHQKMHRHSVY